MTLLPRAVWEAREAAHHERADRLTADHRARSSRQEAHPVEDFLFTYYSYKPAILRRWHPGAGTELADAADLPRAGWRWYRTAGTAVTVDVASLRSDRGTSVSGIVNLLRATANRPASFGCFGLHEWAMVYRQEEHRHSIPLRLGRRATDAVVDAADLRCTHIDAFRFFTDAAAPRNRWAPTRETQAAFDQPGCLHANMDLYKWAVKLGPLVPGDLLLDAFELARDIRWTDMAAAPYDLADWGVEPIAIETTDGRAAYVESQRAFAERAQSLRTLLLGAVAFTSARGAARGAASADGPRSGPR